MVPLGAAAAGAAHFGRAGSPSEAVARGFDRASSAASASCHSAAQVWVP